MKETLLQLVCSMILTTTLFVSTKTSSNTDPMESLTPMFESGYVLNTGSGTGSGCPPNYTGPNQLGGIQIVDSHFETPGVISSDQLIQGSITVDYDSGHSIDLLPGFEVVQGVTFHAYIDGCVPLPQ